MIDWPFVATRPNGTVERVLFYAKSKAEAITYAEAWARRMGFEIEEADEEAQAVTRDSRREAA